VVHRLEDIEAWRTEISRQAPADKIKVRTGSNDGIVWALRVRPDQAEWHAEVRRDLLLRTVPSAVGLRHEPSIGLGDGEEGVCVCGRCSAVGYGDVTEDVVGGALFEDACPNEEPPMPTALAMMHVPSSRLPRDSPASRGRCDARSPPDPWK